MCSILFGPLKPQPPRREAYGNNYDRYLHDQERYQRALEEFYKDKKKRRVRNAHCAAHSTAWAGAGGGGGGGC
ncbi:hypothetical protein N7486_011133 [Penicillium sp. IBT 16267x]|nr:hypothetical protein N7486_011133 [Penicillium sp. IBT 16267x]